jgi:transposase
MPSSGSTPTATAMPPRSWTATAGVLAQLEVASSQAGYQALFGFVADHAPGRRCWALEGTGCYGAGLAGFLTDQGEWVVEIDRPKRPRGGCD